MAPAHFASIARTASTVTGRVMTRAERDDTGEFATASPLARSAIRPAASGFAAPTTR